MPTLALAFLAGLLTIVSPCTLPIVPAVIASASGPARTARIAGLIAGFGGTFLVATILLAAVLAGGGLTLGPARTVAAILLALAGSALVFARFGLVVDRALLPLVSTGSRLLPAGRGDGAVASAATGLVVGSLLGLIWAPCVGPLMAGAIAAALVAGPTVETLAVGVAYVGGAAAALVAVALVASRVRSRLVRAAGTLRPASGAAMLLLGVLVLSGLDVQLGLGLTLQPDAAPAAAGQGSGGATGDGGSMVALSDYGQAPELTGITAWINSAPTTLAAERGKVVLVHFWTFGCSNCQAVQPYVKAWFERYGGADFTVIGVHTPELSFERDLDNVRQAVSSEDVRFPVAFDPDFATWQAYGNHYWPAFYFVDRKGHIRYTHFGEGQYAEAEAVIRELLAEPG